MRWDANGVIFAYSRAKLAAYSLLSCILAGFFGWAYWNGLAKPGSLPEFAFLAGAPLFAFASVGLLIKTFGDPNVLTISRDGILDKRISETILPWRSIRGLSVRNVHRQSLLMVDLDPSFAATLEMTKMARFARTSPVASGRGSLAIPTQGLDGSMDDLLAVIRHFTSR